ncbi:hypothetical protein Sjap_000545 [Stephania japonica]|uniref:Uncharacterized protein n=1 Tax=Stephania japonica TaxID=461633 RepID=A0AAP0KJ87_9MAGN
MDHEMKTLKTKDELSDGVLITVRSVAAAAAAARRVWARSKGLRKRRVVV